MKSFVEEPGLCIGISHICFFHWRIITLSCVIWCDKLCRSRFGNVLPIIFKQTRPFCCHRHWERIVLWNNVRFHPDTEAKLFNPGLILLFVSRRIWKNLSHCTAEMKNNSSETPNKDCGKLVFTFYSPTVSLSRYQLTSGEWSVTVRVWSRLTNKGGSGWRRLMLADGVCHLASTLFPASSSRCCVWHPLYDLLK